MNQQVSVRKDQLGRRLLTSWGLLCALQKIHQDLMMQADEVKDLINIVDGM